jgi:hypothetical protein
MSKTTDSKKEAAVKKAALMISLPDLLNRANSDPQAAQVALQAFTTLNKKPPASLVTKENVSKALSSLEISKSLRILATTKNYVDLSIPLNALRTSAGHGVTDALSRNSISQIATALSSNLLKISGVSPKPKKALAASASRENPPILFTESTITSVSNVLLWILPLLLQPQKKKSRTALPLAIRLVSTFDVTWRHSFHSKTAGTVIRFFRDLRGSVPLSIYSDLMDEIGIAALAGDARSALHDEAVLALREGRLKDLQNIFRLVTEPTERTKLISELQELCINHPSQVFKELGEWIEREADIDTPQRRKLIPANKSQSSELNYVVVSLLDAWDAAANDDRALRSLDSIKRLARELFDTEFFNRPGEVVQYDELKHELLLGAPATSSVEIVRPGIQHSDGARTSFLVRAVAKPIG